jgi:hypothetical protein
LLHNITPFLDLKIRPNIKADYRGLCLKVKDFITIWDAAVKIFRQANAKINPTPGWLEEVD